MVQSKKQILFTMHTPLTTIIGMTLEQLDGHTILLQGTPSAPVSFSQIFHQQKKLP